MNTRLHMHSVACVGNSFSFSVKCYNIYLGCLDSYLSFLSLYAVFKVHFLSFFWKLNGDNEIRTRDLLLARQALSQLSYTPKKQECSCFRSGLKLALPPLRRLRSFLKPMGLSGLEPPTSRLSGVRSNRLSYKPLFFFKNSAATYSPTPSPVQYPRPSGS